MRIDPWSSAVHGLLRHLENAGCLYAPRGLGIDKQGREILSYLPGETGWHDELDRDSGLV